MFNGLETIESDTKVCPSTPRKESELKGHWFFSNRLHSKKLLLPN